MRATESMAFVLAAGLVLVLACNVFAGDLEPGTFPAPTMKTLEEIPGSWHRSMTAADRFQSALGGAAVLDLETGLVWATTTVATGVPGTLSWDVAVTQCNAYGAGGRRGWRLPTIEEASTLAENELLPAGVFNEAQVLTGWFLWTATPSLSAPATSAWAYLFNTTTRAIATSVSLSKTTQRNAICVRGPGGYPNY